MSALSVLSNEDVRDKFIYENMDEWKICGAFCVKFYDQGKEDIIIISDYYGDYVLVWLFDVKIEDRKPEESSFF